jgi:hypothetical protein
MKPSCPRLHAFVRGVLLALAIGFWPACRAQEKAPPTFDDWKKLEPAPELATYRSQLRDNVFGEAEKTFLTKTALPQLGNPKNRPEIDRVRRKMIDRLCVVDAGAGDGKALGAAMQTVADFMSAVARDRASDPVHRVNAILLVGELRVPGNKPWTPAVAPLAAVFGDDTLPPSVRIAAAAGLARHVEADPVGRAADVGPVLVKVAGSPLPNVDPVAANWLRSRAFAMLARMGTDAPAGAVAAASAALLDATRPVDDRVRAAATVGACVKAAGDADAGKTVTAIRDLAVSALGATKASADRLALAERLAGGDQAASRPRGPTDGAGDTLDDEPSQVYRRDAWRLATLADALSSPDGSGGLAAVGGAGAASIKEIATAFRSAAEQLDAQPDLKTLETVLANVPAVDLGREPAPAAPSGGAKPAGPATPAAGADDNPFGS